MTIRSVTFCAALLLLTSLGGAAATVELRDRADYQQALRASSQGLHEVAAVKFQRMLGDRNISRPQAASLSERLVDALIRSRQTEKATTVLTLYQVPDAGFWKAQVLVLQEKHREAEAELKAYLSTSGRYLELAKLALGQVLCAQVRENTGRKEFKDLLAAQNAGIAARAKLLHYESEVISERSATVLKRLGNERQEPSLEFVKACAFLKLGEGKQAEIILRRLMEKKNTITKNLHDASLVRLAEAYFTQGRLRTAEKLLLQFLDQDVSTDYYEEAFALLGKVRTPEGGEDVLTRLQTWSTAAQADLKRALALFYLAEVEMEADHPDQAIEALSNFYEGYPGHARAGEVLRQLMELHGARRDDEKVLEIAKLWQKRYGTGGDEVVDFLTGMIHFTRSELSEAAELFERSARIASDTVLRNRALYNLAVCAWLNGEQARFQQCVAQLQDPSSEPGASSVKPGAASAPAAQLLLEKALVMASKLEPGAEEALQEFIKSQTADPRISEAYLALAELCLLALPPRVRSAQTALDSAATAPGISETMRERIGYTRIWLQEAGDMDLAMISEGMTFLDLWPKSTRRDEVRSKIAQAHYRLQDYAKAEAQFEALVEENPDSPYAEVALFFAGKAAMNLLTTEGVDKALTLWAEVATRNGPLAREARREQASAKRRQGRETDALAVIESLLTSKPPPTGEERLSLLIEKGELLALLSTASPKLLIESVSLFASIARDTSTPRHWRSRAGVLLAQTYLQMGKNAEALEASSDVVEQCLESAAQQPLSPQDYLWFYRAGFTALDQLEVGQSWEAAARLADRLAKTAGDRAQEAKLRATRLRLEHFLWE